ncbi:MAG: pyrroloquinoline quinone precursor peptide PqqA [Burkholderiales bacterium]|jgi:coenzyme PQQ precursor peptide PqqA
MAALSAPALRRQHAPWNHVVPAGAKPGPLPLQPERRLSMQWQTPVATDIRLGFEITMYVAAR